MYTIKDDTVSLNINMVKNYDFYIITAIGKFTGISEFMKVGDLVYKLYNGAINLRSKASWSSIELSGIYVKPVEVEIKITKE